MGKRRAAKTATVWSFFQRFSVNLESHSPHAIDFYYNIKIILVKQYGIYALKAR